MMLLTETERNKTGEDENEDRDGAIFVFCEEDE